MKNSFLIFVMLLVTVLGWSQTFEIIDADASKTDLNFESPIPDWLKVTGIKFEAYPRWRYPLLDKAL
jgi:hypothetical protein